MVWATRYFQNHLQGQRFILFTDHKPLQTWPDLPANKTLTKLQQLALEEIGQAQEGPDHLGVRRRFPVSGHFDLGGGHVNVALSNPETHDVGRVGAQL